jgi:hypothetical protein
MSLFLLVSLVLLSILNLRGLWNVFISPAAGPITSQDVAPLTDVFNSVQSKLDTPFVYLFWILIGCVAYGIVAGIQYAITISKREAKESHFTHTNESSPINYWQSVMATNLLVLTSAISIIIYTILYIRFLLPGFSKLFYNGLYNPSHYQGLADVLGSILASTASIYIFILLCRVLRYNWHTIRPI